MSLFNLLFPRTCPFCGSYISDQQIRETYLDWICPDCWRRLPRTEQDLKAENSTYRDEPEWGISLGRQAVLGWRDERFFEEIDVIIPVPLHPKRLRERGYNQSEYIARGISEITGIPIDTTHLTRTRNTPKQALQDGEGRKTNVAGAFAVNHPEQLYHQRILVVDDLITTGETMRSCLQAMRAFRGAQISVFALCKAR